MSPSVRVLMKPRHSLLRRKWTDIKRDVCVLDVVIVNAGDGRQVSQRCGPDDHRFNSIVIGQFGILSSGFAILDGYADPREYRRHRQGNEYHVQGDVSAHHCGKLSRRPGAAAGSEVS